MSEYSANQRPRPVPVYYIEDVVRYILDREHKNVRPYLNAVVEASGTQPSTLGVIVVDPTTPNFKMRELKELIYSYFGETTYFFVNGEEA